MEVIDSAPVSHSTEQEVFTPLCIVARPQVWRRELACGQRREHFKHIREYFYTLVDTYQAETEASHEPANKQKGTAIEFFSDLFGLKYLRNYIGEITFFQRLSWMMENTSLDYAFIGTAQEDAKLPAQPPELPHANSATTWNLFQDNPRSNGARDSRLDVVVPPLFRRCHVLHRDADEMQKMKHELKSISHTPSANLLMHIGNTFRLVSYSASHLSTLFEVQQIKQLKVYFDGTDDDDERRTMEEDITGKILWLCWGGICAEWMNCYQRLWIAFRETNIQWGYPRYVSS
ncbi:hypothetical protein EDC04DRAFT_1841205 [Pisolithus marmoratus]|nr:hypothetical protein EDC04DRAFT_1841205 [Pisolithus marmoratus]